MDYLGEQILLCYQTLFLNSDVLKQTARLICDLEVSARSLTLSLCLSCRTSTCSCTAASRTLLLRTSPDSAWPFLAPPASPSAGSCAELGVGRASLDSWHRASPAVSSALLGHCPQRGVSCDTGCPGLTDSVLDRWTWSCHAPLQPLSADTVRGWTGCSPLLGTS